MNNLYRCDICLEQEDTIKCNICSFKSSKICIINWYKTNKNSSCPQCKNFKTFDDCFYNISYEIDNDEILLEFLKKKCTYGLLEGYYTIYERKYRY